MRCAGWGAVPIAAPEGSPGKTAWSTPWSRGRHETADSTSSRLSDRDFLDAPLLGTRTYSVPHTSMPHMRGLSCPALLLESLWERVGPEQQHHEVDTIFIPAL